MFVRVFVCFLHAFSNSVRLTDGENFDEESLQNFANALGRSWPSLAEKLDFSTDECQAITVAYSGQVFNQALRMVTSWKDKYAGSNLMGELKWALRCMEMNDLLEELGETNKMN